MNHITTVEQLAKTLDTIDPLEHAKIMKNIKISAAGLESFATWLDF